MHERAQRIGVGLGRTVTALASIAVLGTMGYGWWAFGDVNEGIVTTDVIDSEVAAEKVPLDGAVDMLLVGLDSRTDAYGNPLPREVLDMLHAGRSDGERNTDTMILVHIPVDGTRAVAISFPRDSWVELAGGFGKHRLNSAFAYAYNDARETLVDSGVDDLKRLDAEATVAGRKNLIATIEQLIGKAVTIDRYAEVNLASFYEVTKAIGGVEVCLNEVVDERLSGASFPAGRQTISGAQALAFVRQRHELPNGDLDRIVRQQVFLGALADKVLSADMLASPVRARELIGAVQRSVVLSKGWDLPRFAAQMQGLSSGAIDFHTIPTQGDAKIGGADVLRVDPAQVHAFVAALIGDTSSEPSTPSSTPPSRTSTTTPTSTPTTSTSSDARPALGEIVVDVRNGSDTTGLAAAVLNSLADKGFQPGTTGDTPVRSTSVINFAPGQQNIAQYIADELGGQFTLEVDRGLGFGRLRVVLGTDYAERPDGFAAGHLLELPPPTEPADSTASTASTKQPPPSGSSTAPTPRINAGGVPCVN